MLVMILWGCGPTTAGPTTTTGGSSSSLADTGSGGSGGSSGGGGDSGSGSDSDTGGGQGSSGGGGVELDGEVLYDDLCAGCHGGDGRGTSAGPGILEDVREQDYGDMAEVILEGDGTMPGFPWLTPDQLDNLIFWMWDEL